MSLALVYALSAVFRLGQILLKVLIPVCFFLLVFLILFLAQDYAVRTTPYDSFGNGGSCPSCGERSSSALASDPVGGKLIYPFHVRFTCF